MKICLPVSLGLCLGQASTILRRAGSEPVLGKPSDEPPTGPITSDGTCGRYKDNTVCGDWPQGGCCSLYGVGNSCNHRYLLTLNCVQLCGNSSAHCEKGCQSGPCKGQTLSPAPGPVPAKVASTPGAFEIVGQSGVPAMHASLMPNGKVVFLDKVETYSQIKLPNGRYAFSSEYDPVTNSAVGLSIKVYCFAPSV